jgi:hypothetical protein
VRVEASQADCTLTVTANEALEVAANPAVEAKLDIRKANTIANRANLMGSTCYVIWKKPLE